MDPKGGSLQADSARHDLPLAQAERQSQDPYLRFAGRRAETVIRPLAAWLRLTKNSSLAVAIGYPDLVQVFTGTVLNQTGQAVEVVAVTMAVYLTISLVTSFVMNIYNKRMALVER